MITARVCSKEEKAERDTAIVDYYLNNRLIAYGEIPDSVPEDLPREVREEIIRQRVECFCLRMYKQDMERIRRKYAGTNNKS